MCFLKNNFTFNEQFLKKLGFTEFEHLDKSKRDYKKRLNAVVYVEDGCFIIRLIYLNNDWKIERFFYEGDEAVYKRYFPYKPELKNIIDVLFFNNEPPRSIKELSR